jgi:His/Glu/Gln/Arg/opine family amino acid ABC transporter permease subunit
MIGFFKPYFEYGAEWWPRMLDAAGKTAMITLAGFVVAILIGSVLAFLQQSRFKTFRVFSQGYVVLFRGVPLLAVLFLLYFGLPGIGITLTAFSAGAIGLGLCFGAQMAEVFRAGFEAIHRGQREAALAIGMTPFVSFRLIILPLLLRIVLPSLVATFVALLKDSSLCALITINELMLEGRALATEYFLPLPIFVAIGLLYFVIAWPLSMLARHLNANIQKRKLSAA